MNKLNKTFSTLVLATLATLASANKDYYLLDNEVKIVKLKNFMQKSIKNDKDAKFIKERVNEYKKNHDDMTTHGFVNEDNPNATSLLGLISQMMKNPKARHPGIAKDANKIPVAYDYTPLTSNIYDTHLGYSEGGVYRQKSEEYKKEGWTGIGEIFVKNDLDCIYSEHNIKLAHGGIELIEEMITYDINKKPTVLLVKGSDKTGYIYNVNWYGNDFDKELKCAKNSYSKETMEEVIALAIAIDNK